MPRKIRVDPRRRDRSVRRARRAQRALVGGSFAASLALAVGIAGPLQHPSRAEPPAGGHRPASHQPEARPKAPQPSRTASGRVRSRRPRPEPRHHRRRRRHAAPVPPAPTLQPSTGTPHAATGGS